MDLSRSRFEGYDCLELRNESLTLHVTTNVGPRILGLALHGRENLLAVLPEEVTRTPSGSDFRFRGGHRLWHAPEHAERTYIPDDDPVTIEEIELGVHLVQQVETSTGIEKQMRITLPDHSPTVVIDHTLVNRGVWPVELAPWAITQLRPGGFAFLPQSHSEDGLLPNRQFAFWPYSRLDSPHLQWGNRFVFFHAAMKNGAFKMGWANPAGWLGYCLGATTFVKQAAYLFDEEYLDFGSSSECYCNPKFLELETLGPKTLLDIGERVNHRETWSLYDTPNLTPSEADISAWAKSVELE